MPMPKEVLSKYAYNRIFVETGIGLGDCVALAVELGFKQIYSIEQSLEQCKLIQKRFVDCPQVKIIHGASEVVLAVLLKRIDERVTFWLDAHQSQIKNFASEMPLLEELAAIKAHHIKDHTILIDDMNFFRKSKGWKGVTKKRIKHKLRHINSNYHLRCVASPADERAILVAEVGW